MSTDPTDYLAEAASLDPAIRARVIALANNVLDEAEYLIKYGDPNMKSSLVRSFMTSFAKHMRTEDTNQETEKLRGELERLRNAVVSRVPGAQDILEDENTKRPVGRPPHVIEGEMVDNPPIPLLDRRRPENRPN